MSSFFIAFLAIAAATVVWLDGDRVDQKFSGSCFSSMVECVLEDGQSRSVDLSYRIISLVL